MTEKYSLPAINKNIKNYGRYKIERSKDGTHFITPQGKRIPLLITTPGMIDEHYVDKIAEEISIENKRKKQTEIFYDLTNPRYTLM
jgi:hypothetical protein